MKAMFLPLLMILTGCTTTVEVTKQVMPDPPAQFMTPPTALQKLAVGPGDPKAILSIAVLNNTAAVKNAHELEDLQKWITDTKKNIQSSGKPQP